MQHVTGWKERLLALLRCFQIEACACLLSEYLSLMAEFARRNSICLLLMYPGSPLAKAFDDSWPSFEQFLAQDVVVGFSVSSPFEDLF